MQVFNALNDQFQLEAAANRVAEQLRQSGYLDKLMEPGHGFDLTLEPEGQGDGFFTLVCEILAEEGSIGPAVAGMLVELASEMFFEQLGHESTPDDVENIRGYLIDCEVRVNGRPLHRDD